MDNLIPVRDYMESLVDRLEVAMRQQIDALRADIDRLQHDYVTRAEFDTMSNNIQRELDRIERHHNEKTRETKDDLINRLTEFKEDIKRSNERSLVLWGLIVGVLGLVAQLIVNVMF